MRYFLLLLFLIAFDTLWCQEKHLLYNQTHNPQSLILNPGAAYEKTDFHIGVPFLSNIYASSGNSILTIDDFFNSNNFNTNIESSLDRISSRDFLAFNQKLEFINVGWRQGQRYFSAGVYQESDGIFNFPKDLLELAYYGNAGQSRSYDIGQINFRANLQTVFHIGMNTKVNDNLHLGIRGKLYTSSLNIRSVRNTGLFTSTQPQTGVLLNQNISNLNLRFDTAGIDNAEELTTGGILIGSNYGLGIDLGLSYNFKDKWEFTASLLDLGFIQFSKDTRRSLTRGFYDYEGFNFDMQEFSPGADLASYYLDLSDQLEENIPSESTTDSYTYMQPTKLNLGLSYDFGGERRPCDCRSRLKGRLKSNQRLSLHAFSMVSAGNIFYSLNAIYERSFWKTLYAKVSLGVDQFNRPNYGAGLSLDVWKINLFVNVDRLNHFSNIYNAKALAYQFGLNLKL